MGIRWGNDSRHVALYQRLANTPPGLTEPYAIGVIDTEDPDLTWMEYGNTNVGTRTRPFPLFSKKTASSILTSRSAPDAPSPFNR